MDPDSGPRNKDAISIATIDKKRTYYEENNNQKNFYLAHFNDCNLSLVTGKISFSSNYELLSCNLTVTLLDDKYQSMSDREDDFSLSDLFQISEMFTESPKYALSFDGENMSSDIFDSGYNVPVPLIWTCDSAVKEDKPRYMDINDKMISYIYAKLCDANIYADNQVFKTVEYLYGFQNVKSFKKAS